MALIPRLLLDIIVKKTSRSLKSSLDLKATIG